MKAIYLFNETSRAAAYGIGTYIKQMAAAFSGKEDTLLTVVELHHNKKEFTIECNDNTRYIYIPSHRVNYRLKQEVKLDRYYQSVLFLLSPIIDTKADNIFHFNFNQSERIISLLKEKYPLSKTVITIHYLSWCFQLKGNTSYFKEIGKLEKSRLFELYQIADIGIMLSFHEQCSYVVMEMLMHGIPLVITDSTGLSKVVEPEKNRYKINLKEKEDQIELPVEECTQYIIKTLQTDKAIWQKKCRQNFKIRYHLDVMHRQVLKPYTTL